MNASSNAISIDAKKISAGESTQGMTLGLTLIGHDISYVVLGADGSPIMIAEDERYSRQKRGFFAIVPSRLEQVLEEANVDPTDFRHIAIANIPELSESRYPQEADKSTAIQIEHLSNVLYRNIIRKFREIETVAFVRHHLCGSVPEFYQPASQLSIEISMYR